MKFNKRKLTRLKTKWHQETEFCLHKYKVKNQSSQNLQTRSQTFPKPLIAKCLKGKPLQPWAYKSH